MQTETEYRGLTIKRVKNFDQDCLGFTVDAAYQVVDELDDLAVPDILQQMFWSPYEAMVAIDFALEIMPRVKSKAKYGTSIAYEFNRLLAMRRHIVPLVVAIEDLRAKAQDALDFDDPMPATVVLEAIGRMDATRFG